MCRNNVAYTRYCNDMLLRRHDISQGLYCFPIALSISHSYVYRCMAVHREDLVPHLSSYARIFGWQGQFGLPFAFLSPRGLGHCLGHVNDELLVDKWQGGVCVAGSVDAACVRVTCLICAAASC